MGEAHHPASEIQQLGLRTALLSIHLANLCFLLNDDKLLLLNGTKRDFAHPAALSFTETWSLYPRQWITFLRYSLTPSRLCNGIRENKRRQKVGVQRSHFCIDKLNPGIIIHKLLTFLFIKGIFLIHRGRSCR